MHALVLCSLWGHACKYVQSVPAHFKAALQRWVVCSAYLQHLHSCCLQRSTHTKGGEQWCFLQASDEQPTETPCAVTTWSSSERCSWSRGMRRPLNLTSRKQPGKNRGKEEKETLSPQAKCFKSTHLHSSRGINSGMESHINYHRLADTPADQCSHTTKHTNSLRLRCQHGFFLFFWVDVLSLLVSLRTLCETWGLTLHVNAYRCHLFSPICVKLTHQHKFGPDTQALARPTESSSPLDDSSRFN